MTQEMKDTFKEIGELFLKMADQLEKYEEKEVDEEGWIKFEGGEQPKDTIGKEVSVEFADGSTHSRFPADDYVWHHEGAFDDIVAYKILEA